MPLLHPQFIQQGLEPAQVPQHLGRVEPARRHLGIEGGVEPVDLPFHMSEELRPQPLGRRCRFLAWLGAGRLGRGLILGFGASRHRGVSIHTS
ncbi:hypothetical protein ASG52_22255 [Methylobacterium sp. Leaf456]|nr:hypothetical protein ASG52_22255 [Methylobacterium sp. Leaf456]